ncbi:hypothetical protein [Advenella kashmirensis]|uniref:hypothetical protein n=1 Tax=Advenella kashmirensis TaxID=310575 RepID=UPI0011D24FEF|nr:hypothetical protein [Advenella kashmirensis]
MMSNRATVTAKLLVAVMNSKAWEKDIPVLLTGLLGQQQRGTWSTTTANVWGTLAVRSFSASFEKTPVKGTLSMSLQAAGAPTSADQQWEACSQRRKSWCLGKTMIPSNCHYRFREPGASGHPWLPRRRYQ